MSSSIANAYEVNFVRHGESTWNVEGRMQGQGILSTSDEKPEGKYQIITGAKGEKFIDSAVLTEKGKEQAKELAEVIKASLADKRNVLLLSSDLLRCKQTAEVVEKTLKSAGFNVTVQYDPRLREANHGRLSGMYEREYRALDYFQNYKKLNPEEQFKTAMDPLFGENYLTVAKRTHDAIVDAIKQFPEHEIYAITHGGPMRASYAYLKDDSVPFSDEYNIANQIKNCAMMTVRGYGASNSNLQIELKNLAK